MFAALQIVADASCFGHSAFARRCENCAIFAAKISLTVETTVKIFLSTTAMVSRVRVELSSRKRRQLGPKRRHALCVNQLAPSENQDSFVRLRTRRFLLSQNLPSLVSVDLAEQIHQVADLDIFQRTYRALDFLTQFLVSVTRVRWMPLCSTRRQDPSSG